MASRNEQRRQGWGGGAGGRAGASGPARGCPRVISAIADCATGPPSPAPHLKRAGRGGNHAEAHVAARDGRQAPPDLRGVHLSCSQQRARLGDWLSPVLSLLAVWRIADGNNDLSRSREVKASGPGRPWRAARRERPARSAAAITAQCGPHSDTGYTSDTNWKRGFGLHV